MKTGFLGNGIVFRVRNRFCTWQQRTVTRLGKTHTAILACISAVLPRKLLLTADIDPEVIVWNMAPLGVYCVIHG